MKPARVLAAMALQARTALDLAASWTTDAGVPVLVGFTQLRHLDLYHSLVTSDGLARLRGALPRATVIWDRESNLPHRRRA